MQRWMRAKFVESYIKWKLPLKKYNIVPRHSFEEQISSCKIVLLPDKFYSNVEQGSIVLKKAANWSFCEKGVVCEGDASPIEADLVILATGYRGDKKLKNIFKSPLFRNIISRSEFSTLGLYRYALCPSKPWHLSLSAIFFFSSRSRARRPQKYSPIADNTDQIIRWMIFFR